MIGQNKVYTGYEWKTHFMESFVMLVRLTALDRCQHGHIASVCSDHTLYRTVDATQRFMKSLSEPLLEASAVATIDFRLIKIQARKWILHPDVSDAERQWSCP